MMRALILSSRCTVEQRRALLELRAFLESKTQNLIQINDCPLRGVA